MSASIIQDRISRGLGTAARHIGAPYDAFRATSATNPTDPANRFLQLPAAFSPGDASFRQPPSYGHATWSGLFDTAYTQPGDYLRGPVGTFFIAAQPPFQAALCILTNDVLSIARPAAPTSPGINDYGGLSLATATPLLTSWPASLLVAGSGPTAELPGDGAPGTWTILLPQLPVALRSADLLTDAEGRTYVINTAERTALGWRIGARQAAI